MLIDLAVRPVARPGGQTIGGDRKSTRLNSSHTVISYAVFCLKKKKKQKMKNHLKTTKQKTISRSAIKLLRDRGNILFGTMNTEYEDSDYASVLHDDTNAHE